MQLFTALLVASLCATAWSASPIAIREFEESQVKVQELNSKLTSALTVAKGRIDAFLKALGQNKEKILTRIDELETKIQELNKKIIVDSSVNKAQQLIRKLMKVRLQKALERLEGLRSKIQKLK